MDKNIIYTDLGNGYFNLKPKKGYALFSVRLNRAVSEAVVEENDLQLFIAVKK